MLSSLWLRSTLMDEHLKTIRGGFARLRVGPGGSEYLNTIRKTYWMPGRL